MRKRLRRKQMRRKKRIRSKRNQRLIKKARNKRSQMKLIIGKMPILMRWLTKPKEEMTFR